MVSALTMNTISLFKPLFSQPLCFFRLANGTIALISVFFIKLVSVFTQSLFSVNRCDRIRVFYVVLPRCYNPQMIGVYTSSIFTKMVNKHSFRNITKFAIIRKAMGSSKFFMKIKSPVTIFIEVIFPYMTSSDFIPKRIKSIYVFLLNMLHVAHYRKKYLISQYA